MSTLFYISIGPRGDYSISRQLGNAAVEAWKARNPKGRVVERVERDLTRTPLTFVDLDRIAGAFSPTLLTRNFHEVFDENHPKGRRAAIDEIFSTRQSERTSGHDRSNCSATF
jgi:FMN-dependent NADH-azoreductase